MLCWNCLADDIGITCHICEGSGKIEQKKKPKSLLNSDTRIYFKQYTYLKNYSIWPIEGGLNKQDSKFLKVLDYCDAVKNRHDEIKTEIDKTNATLRNKQLG